MGLSRSELRRSSQLHQSLERRASYQAHQQPRWAASIVSKRKQRTLSQRQAAKCQPKSHPPDLLPQRTTSSWSRRGGKANGSGRTQVLKCDRDHDGQLEKRGHHSSSANDEQKAHALHHSRGQYRTGEDQGSECAVHASTAEPYTKHCHLSASTNSGAQPDVDEAEDEDDTAESGTSRGRDECLCG